MHNIPAAPVYPAQAAPDRPPEVINKAASDLVFAPTSAGWTFRKFKETNPLTTLPLGIPPGRAYL